MQSQEATSYTPMRVFFNLSIYQTNVLLLKEYILRWLYVLDLSNHQYAIISNCFLIFSFHIHFATGEIHHTIRRACSRLGLQKIIPLQISYVFEISGVLITFIHRKCHLQKKEPDSLKSSKNRTMTVLHIIVCRVTFAFNPLLFQRYLHTYIYRTL